ncbi:MAG TPA: protein kinase [Terracidiphilus sp.]|nr:protein kinase [Terracidiphilus sp.]
MTTRKMIGRYEILDELGHGAMGSVFRAHDPAMDRIVALKTILSMALASDHGAEFRERFYREARAAGALAHPGIVPVLDVGEHEGVPFLVMEFVKGKTLADAMKTGERLSMDRVCELGQQIAEALDYAHRKGVVHRDIRPANILLTSRESHGTERPRITDFGVAKLAEGENASTGQLLGTLAFIPPEQFTGAPIDGRTDLFSLGVILYWMATGEQPFPGETMTTVSYKIVHTEPVPPAKLNPAVPAQLEEVILKCLSKSPADRYQTGAELSLALKEVRARTAPTSMKTTIPRSTLVAGNAEDMLDATPGHELDRTSSNATLASADRVPEPMPVPPAKKRYGPVVVAAVLLPLLAAGSWIVFHHRASLAANTHPVPQQPAPGPSAASTPAATSTTAPKKPSPAIPAARGTPAVAANNGTPPLASPAAPQQHPPPGAFSPKTLDPKQNTRLKIDLSHFPAGVAFAIEIDGKLYYKGSPSNKSDYDNMFVAPGAHELRVTVSGGNIQRTSNSVRAQFAAKKRMSLKVEIKRRSNGALVPSPGFDSSAQVFATLKEDHFFF